MTLGVVLLWHEHLGRAAQAARHWAAGGTPVVVHVDVRVPGAAVAAARAALADLPGVVFVPRRRCDWGRWGIVAATLDACERLLAAAPDVTHVCLASGACLPLRPVAELAAHVGRHPDTDFIESVATSRSDWTGGGLSGERFTLRFPFCWRRQRRLFDAAVAVQRRLGLHRRLPEGMVPHLGSQWWCLTRATLAAILTDPRRAEFDRFFRQAWIPDESYFQTLARRHARRIESRSLTLARFDHAGRPHLFYDDHVALLRRSGCFVARKIWPGADLLYRSFPVPAGPGTLPDPAPVDRVFARAAAERRQGRPGLWNQARHPRGAAAAGQTAAPYALLQGLPDLFPGLDAWLAQVAGMTLHGRLFDPAGACFAGGADGAEGGLCAAPALRDDDPRGFLVNLLWAARDRRQGFAARPGDTAAIDRFLAGDPNARLLVVTGAWAVPLARVAAPWSEIRRRADRLRQAEAEQLAIWQTPGARARLRVWSLAAAVAEPDRVLAGVVQTLAGAEVASGGRRPGTGLPPPPAMADPAPLAALLDRLGAPHPPLPAPIPRAPPAAACPGLPARG